MREQRRHWIWLIGSALALAAGCGDYGPYVPAPLGGADAPDILRVTITPTEFDLLGGSVTIQAEVSDPNDDLDTVIAEVTWPDGSSQQVSLEEESPGLFEASYTLPPNPSEEEEDDVYTFVVIATDAEDLESDSEPVDVTVRAAPRPPDPALEGDPPAFERVTIEPTVLDPLGGDVMVEVEVSDPDQNVTRVTAEMMRPDGSEQLLELESQGEGIWNGSFTLPGNPSEDEEPLFYRVRVRAVDAEGLETLSAVETVTVEAAPRPPDPALEGDEEELP